MARPVGILRAMSPLAQRTIATVGSGVMAEAMIAGLLRGALVEPGQVIASHPRAERRDELERLYGIRVTASNREAVAEADVILLGIKPQMLARVGREIGPGLRAGQLVLSVIAGATTKALIGFLGHDQVVRSMPNTPARLGRGMTVWYATPSVTDEQRAQASTLLRALGHELEVDDERFVAMATAVSGTGPTYVFLVMEALIDAAVHLGFPRHVAHDLVVETLEGSTHFAKQSGDHPAVLRNMVTSPGGTSAAALHELESGRLRTVLSEAVWAAYRRTNELAMSGPLVEAPAGEETVAVDLRRDPLPALRALDLRSASRDFWADERAMWDRTVASWAGLDDAAWRLPGAAPSDAGGPDWSFLDHVAHLAAWQEIGQEYVERAIATDAWPSDEDFGGGDFDRFNERTRETWSTIDPAELRARIRVTHDRLVELVRGLPLATIRSDAAWGWVYLVLHGHQLDHLSVIEPWADSLRVRQTDGDPFAVDGEYALTDPTAPIERFWAAEGSIARLFDETVRGVPRDHWEDPDVTAGWTLKDHVAHLAAWFDEAAEALDAHRIVGGWREGPPEGVDAWNARHAARDRGITATAALERFDLGRRRLRIAIRALGPEDLRDPDGWSWAYEDLHGHIRAHLAMIGSWCARVGWPATEGGGR
jgi:pyrroline-5-carboxylate reductase